MPTIKDGKTYSTIDEVSKRLDGVIDDEAQKLLQRLQKTKKIHKKVEYV